MSFSARLNNVYQALRGSYPGTLTEQDIPHRDLTSQWVIVSGANSGVGFETAKLFAAWGANLVLVCREPPSWEQHPDMALEECKAAAFGHGHTSSSIEYWQADFSNLQSVEAFCQRWLDTGRVLNVLCNNAGTVSSSKTRMTDDGFQIVHQVRRVPSQVYLVLWLKISCLGQFPVTRSRNTAPPPISCPRCNSPNCVYHFLHASSWCL